MKPPPPRLVCASAFSNRAKKAPAGATAITVFRRLRPPDLGLPAAGVPTAFARGTLGRVSPHGAPHAAAATQVVRATAGTRTERPVIGPHRPHRLERLTRPSLSRGVPRPAPGSVGVERPPTAAPQRGTPPPGVLCVRAATDVSRDGGRLVPPPRP